MNTLIFDVESIGLHGEGFAVGFVIVDEYHHVLTENCWSCDPNLAQGLPSNREWVSTNIPKLPITHPTPHALRDAFWQLWLEWRAKDTQMMAEVAWPVEARFLADCIHQNEQSEFQGPYPLLDLSTLLYALGIDPTTPTPRNPDELPSHHPLADARHTARRWREALLKIENLSSSS